MSRVLAPWARRDDEAGAAADLAGALVGLGAERPAPDIDAGFFHRTLARWLGLPEGRAPMSDVPLVEWDYGFWKAELERDEDDAAGSDGELAPGAVRRERWSAMLFRVADEAPERVAWWVDKDERGAIVGSAWRTAAPSLLAARVDDDAGPLDDATMSRLLDADAP